MTYHCSSPVEAERFILENWKELKLHSSISCTYNGRKITLKYGMALPTPHCSYILCGENISTHEFKSIHKHLGAEIPIQRCFLQARAKL